MKKYLIFFLVGTAVFSSQLIFAGGTSKCGSEARGESKNLSDMIKTQLQSK